MRNFPIIVKVVDVEFSPWQLGAWEPLAMTSDSPQLIELPQRFQLALLHLVRILHGAHELAEDAVALAAQLVAQCADTLALANDLIALAEHPVTPALR